MVPAGKEGTITAPMLAVDEPQPLAILEGNRKLSKWVEEKYINFGKFLGGSIEGMEDKVIDLLCCIDHEARCDAKEAGEKKRLPIEEHKWGRKDCGV